VSWTRTTFTNDAVRKRIYVAGGEGFIDVFQQKDADHYQPVSKIRSALGARTAGYFGKGRNGADRFYLPWWRCPVGPWLFCFDEFFRCAGSDAGIWKGLLPAMRHGPEQIKWQW
jgi:hypothetical protein